VSENPLRAVVNAVESGDAAGRGLGWALFASALALAGVAWLRYRTYSRDS
jgi:hypothetical protein